VEILLGKPSKNFGIANGGFMSKTRRLYCDWVFHKIVDDLGWVRQF